jgi:hypothetical protein
MIAAISALQGVEASHTVRDVFGPMRKLSFVFLILAVGTPVATGGYVGKVRHEYVARYGFEPEGMGFAGILLLGAHVTLVLSLAAAVFAAVSFFSMPAPRTWARRIELVAFCIPPILVGLFVAVFFLGAGSAPPQVIHTR